MEKEKYIELVKSELEKLIEREKNEYYEILIDREDIKEFIKIICERIVDFGGDKWELVEDVAGVIFEHFNPNLPGTGLVAKLVLKMFRGGIESYCKDID